MSTTETLPRDRSNVDSDVDSKRYPEAFFESDDAEDVTAPIDTLEDNREVSPTGSRIQRAANRISNFLEKRAIDKAHGDALLEDENRPVDIQDNAYATYADNLTYTKVAARNERNEAIKQRLRDIGERGLTYLRAGGEIALGAGIIGAEATARSVKSAGETTALGAMYGVDRLKSAAETTTLSSMYAAESAKDKAGEYIGDKVTDIKKSYSQTKELVGDYANDKIGTVKRAFMDGREVAKVNRANRITAREHSRSKRAYEKNQQSASDERDRQERRTARRESAEIARVETNKLADEALSRRQDRQAVRREKLANGRERASDVWQTAQGKRRAIGSKAINFFARARATGQAAKNTWDHYDDQNQV